MIIRTLCFLNKLFFYLIRRCEATKECSFLRSLHMHTWARQPLGKWLNLIGHRGLNFGYLLAFRLRPSPPLWALRTNRTLSPLKYSLNWLPQVHLYILTVKIPYFQLLSGLATSVSHFGHLAILNP